MDGILGGLGPQVAALLAGGLGGSLGITFAARSRRMQERLATVSGRVMTIASVVLSIASVAVGWRIISGFAASLEASDATGVASVSVPLAFALGLAVGLPMGVPGLIAAWAEARRKGREAAKKRDWVPTKDDRRAYAATLLAQILDVSPRARALDASIAGDGGSVLRFEGDIDSTEGEKLTAALRADLKDVGFKRVEGTHGSKEWWTRV
jgi:hypothetical protein